MKSVVDPSEPWIIDDGRSPSSWLELKRTSINLRKTRSWRCGVEWSLTEEKLRRDYEWLVGPLIQLIASTPQYSSSSSAAVQPWTECITVCMSFFRFGGVLEAISEIRRQHPENGLWPHLWCHWMLAVPVTELHACSHCALLLDLSWAVRDLSFGRPEAPISYSYKGKWRINMILFFVVLFLFSFFFFFFWHSIISLVIIFFTVRSIICGALPLMDEFYLQCTYIHETSPATYYLVMPISRGLNGGSAVTMNWTEVDKWVSTPYKYNTRRVIQKEHIILRLINIISFCFCATWNVCTHLKTTTSSHQE